MGWTEVVDEAIGGAVSSNFEMIALVAGVCISAIAIVGTFVVLKKILGK